jgi:hypothetical protein
VRSWNSRLHPATNSRQREQEEPPGCGLNPLDRRWRRENQ